MRWNQTRYALAWALLLAEAAEGVVLDEWAAAAAVELDAGAQEAEADSKNLALVQQESFSEGPQGAGRGIPYYTKRTPEDEGTYPDKLQGRKIIGQFCRTYLGWHLFTVGVYLDDDSPAWQKKWGDGNLSELLSHTTGHLTARYKLTSRMNHKLFEQYVIRPMSRSMYDPSKQFLQDFTTAVNRGPKFYEDVVLDFVSTKTGLEYRFQNDLVEQIGGANASKANLGWLIWKDAEVPEVKEMLLKNLKIGNEVDVQKIWAGSYLDKLPAKVIAIIVVGAFAVGGLLFLSCWFVWRRFKRAPQPAPQHGGNKRAGVGRLQSRSTKDGVPPPKTAQ